MRRVALAVVVAVGSFGCVTSLGDVVTAHQEGKGTPAVYPVDVTKAFDLSREVLHAGGALNIEEHRDQGYLLATQEKSAFSWGTLIGVWIEPSPSPTEQAKVTVVTKNKYATSGFGDLDEKRFQRDLAGRVNALAPAPAASALTAPMSGAPPSSASPVGPAPPPSALSPTPAASTAPASSATSAGSAAPSPSATPPASATPASVRPASVPPAPPSPTPSASTTP